MNSPLSPAPLTGPVLVVVSHYDARPSAPLVRLLDELHRQPAGWPYALRVVVNETSGARLPALPSAVEVLRRPNLGFNIGAWEHGWRTDPPYSAYLFLQDECVVRRSPWLLPFVERASEPEIGLLGERLNPAWAFTWEELGRRLQGHRLPAHEVDGQETDRLSAYHAFFARQGIPPGTRGDHLQTLALFARREVLETMGGFPLGRNYGEAIAAEIGTSKKVEALGLRIAQVGDLPFSCFAHPQWLARDAEHRARPRPGVLDRITSWLQR
jgi:hypothetical protein